MENAKNDALSVEKVVYANIETKEVFAKSVEEMVYANIIDAEVRFAKSGWCGGSGSYMRANIINAEVIAKSVEEVVYANIIIFSSSTEILFEVYIYATSLEYKAPCYMLHPNSNIMMYYYTTCVRAHSASPLSSG